MRFLVEACIVSDGTICDAERIMEFGGGGDDGGFS
jgi:hypothetical protein